MSAQRLVDRIKRTIPQPMDLAMALTLVAAAVAALRTGSGPETLLSAWLHGAPIAEGGSPVGGIWSLLRFSMQMCLILVTGFVVANTGPVQAALRRLATVPRTARQATVLVAALSMGLCLVNWGLGLIAGAILAREVGIVMHRRGISVHYPLLAAAGYAGMCVWHGGWSGSAPLKMTGTRDLVEVVGADLAASVGTLPLSATIGTWRNLVATGVVCVLVPATLAWLVPSSEALHTPPPTRLVDRDTAPQAPSARARVLSLAVAGAMLAGVAQWVHLHGLSRLGPDTLNLLFFGIGLALAGSAAAYMHHARAAATACAGILVQFPLYGGILGLLAAAGLVDLLAIWLPTTEAAAAATTFVSAGLLNLLVPSGGGQWAIQGPVILRAAAEHGLDAGRLVLALAWGDQWTNLLQPFWALPLLGITGVRAPEVFAYTVVLAGVVGAVFGVGAVV